ncbi:alpha-glucan family phosphorylase [Halanaerobacter jeridensis]|uniref:glycogen phosphorylase n=1 Tax=Halanaerobacter jeridensis TaxID=706427 RepID=A0A939BSU8_9FIRM|nr:alpha-glucan family phosphorylase [Halanaerobacter jeridensis]MBM7557526.1 starch phosphorylase [Halanaerobacter jeridensis]
MTKKKKAVQDPKVAYFCMEYGLDSKFNIYSGGLGILAGDHLKAAQEADYPLVGIGMLWKQGYHKQKITAQGEPYNAYYNYDYNFLEDTGVEVKVKIRNRPVYCKVWKVTEFDNADLYLLDTDLDKNFADDQWITGQLYGWFSEERIAQEMVLGVGGVKALKKLGIEVDLYHFNEGHAVFAGLELIRDKMDDKKVEFNEAQKSELKSSKTELDEKEKVKFAAAWEEVKEQIVFTTHTPVPEGNEKHAHHLLQYMGANLGLSIEEMVELGGAPFNLTTAALRLANKANGVSKLHKETAQEMWEEVEERAPIIGITNGVHSKTWVDKRMVNRFSEGSDEQIWGTHQELKLELLDYIEQETETRLDEEKLLIAFARRAADYKRSDLIFSDLKIIEQYLEEGTIQIVFSGKAHPLDDAGQQTVAKILEMVEQYPESIVFLEDYNIEIAKLLTRGCDLWLNNPRRPKEASGTSGMKAAMNGVLNLSILDGWWPEICRHGQNGWAIAVNPKTEADFSGSTKEKVAKLDEYDTKNLYDVLLNEVVPTYYSEQEQWIKMMKTSHRDTYQPFSAARMIREYYQRLYT